MATRIGIAGFMHESCTFNPTLTDRAAFLEQSCLIGEAILQEWQDAHHEVGGFIEAVPQEGFEPVPLLMAWATPAGPVADEIYADLTGQLAELVATSSLDGLLLALHGAMVSETFLDADGETLSRIREKVGPDLPIVVTLDFHGNISERLIDLCDAAIAYQTCPHVDQRECGLKAARLLAQHLRGEVKLTQALAKPPMIVNIMKHDTSKEPLLSHLNKARELEKEPKVLSASLMAGFAYADVPQMGPSVIVVTDGDPGLAQRSATALGQGLWEDRESFHINLPDAEAAVREAIASEVHPVVLVDTGDNVGGGSAADGTVLLEELLKQKADRSVVCLCAPEEVLECQKVGPGNAISLMVGGKVDRHHGSPVEISGIVRLLHDGTYIEKEVRHGGKRINHMGLTALVELPGENLLVLNSLRHPPFSLGQLTCLGIRPEEQRILVVKAAIAYKAAYGPIAKKIIEVDTPGLTAVSPHHFRYQNIRRPLFPLD